MSTGTAGLNAAWGMYDEPQPVRDQRPDAPSRNHVWMRVCSSLPKRKANGCSSGWWTARPIDDPKRFHCPACNAALDPTRIVAEGWRGGAVPSASEPLKPRTKRNNRVTRNARDHSSVLCLYMGGLTTREAGDAVGRSRSTVTGWIRAAGIARPRGKTRRRA